MNHNETPKDADAPLVQWLTFIIGDETYGIDVLYVREVLRYTEVSPVPGAPSHVLGIINVRGTVVAVKDMRAMLGVSSVEVTDQTRIVLSVLNDEIHGMVVDSVLEIVSIRPSEIDNTTVSGKGNPLILGTVQKHDKLYILLSMRELMMDNDTL